MNNTRAYIDYDAIYVRPSLRGVNVYIPCEPLVYLAIEDCYLSGVLIKSYFLQVDIQ